MLFETSETTRKTAVPIGTWPHCAVIARNNFVYKSLSNWAFNIAVGCSHGCSFCYVPSAATIKQGPKLAELGVSDPDLEWGKYVLLRQWDESEFRRSVRAAKNTPIETLPADGNRAVMYCSTTDPYQVFYHPDQAVRTDLTRRWRTMMTRSLEIIRDESDLNVRILTRGPLAKLDFPLMKSYGKRLLFGMSLPTLDNQLARLYEPAAPSPQKRLDALKAAVAAGLNVYVAVAPTFPESDESDLLRTLKAVAELNPVTVFHEPINIRSENVARIAARACELKLEAKTNVFATPATWQEYAITSLKTVEKICRELGLLDRLHLWPDKALGSSLCVSRAKNPGAYRKWLERAWNRISEWPK